MLPSILNTIGLILGIIGVGIIFRFGPPQPNLEEGVALGLRDNTPIDKSGKTVSQHNAEIRQRRLVHSNFSKLGLLLILVGFGFQLWAVWAK